jgi:hypothetical protein
VTALTAAFFLVSCALGFALVAIYQLRADAKLTKVLMQYEIAGLEAIIVRMTRASLDQRDRALATAPARFDDQTTVLVRLAAHSPEREEAATAAILVCKQLAKNIDVLTSGRRRS